MSKQLTKKTNYKYCGKCGKRNPPDYNYCSDCGKKLSSPEKKKLAPRGKRQYVAFVDATVGRKSSKTGVLMVLIMILLFLLVLYIGFYEWMQGSGISSTNVPFAYLSYCIMSKKFRERDAQTWMILLKARYFTPINKELHEINS